MKKTLIYYNGVSRKMCSSVPRFFGPEKNSTRSLHNQKIPSMDSLQSRPVLGAGYSHPSYFFVLIQLSTSSNRESIPTSQTWRDPLLCTRRTAQQMALEAGGIGRLFRKQPRTQVCCPSGGDLIN
jgi:hypothetical protein